MKKIFILFTVLVASVTSFAQAIDNPGMETWRTNSAGTGPVIAITAPTSWYGFDSLVIAGGEAFGAIIGAGSDWKKQLYQENTFVHGGSAAAKLITVKQDTLGLVPGTMSNAQPTFDAGVIAGGGDPASALGFTGGTATNLRITSATAWVAYFPGKDATTGVFGGPDKGVMNVQALATVGSKPDSVVGLGGAMIDPSTSYVSVTANLTYNTTAYNVHTVRIIFSSGGGSGASLDSSIMYVDDVSMVGEPQSVSNVAYNANVVKIYPNPSEGVFYLDGPTNSGYTCTVSTATGSVVTTRTLKGADKMDISSQPTGLYMYSIANAAGEVVQTGKLTVRH